MSELIEQEVVAVRHEACRGSETRRHVVRVKLASGGDLSAADAIELMDLGGTFFMIPPPGAPACEAHMVTGLPLLLQHRHCDECNEEVLFA